MGLTKDLDERASMACFFFNWVLQNMMVPGHVEQWMIIMDFEGVSIGEIPVKSLKNLISTL